MNTDDDISPSFDRSLPYRVPEGYFDQLQQRIEEQCATVAPQPEAPSTPFYVMLRAQLSLVAGFALLALLASMAYFYMQLPAAAPSSVAPVEVVSRTVDYSPRDHREALERQQHQQRMLDSLNDFTRGKYLRYSRNRSYSTISEEKWDVQQPPAGR